MLRVHLTVLPQSAASDDNLGEDWGEWDFNSLPRAGDHIDLERLNRRELLTVRRVIHFAVQHPVPRSEEPFKQRKQSSIRVVALRVRG